MSWVIFTLDVGFMFSDFLSLLATFVHSVNGLEKKTQSPLEPNEDFFD